MIRSVLAGSSWFLLMVLLLTSCDGNKSREKIPPQALELELDVRRFEVDLIAVDTVDIISSLQGLWNAYPDFYPLFVEDLYPVAERFEDFDQYAPMIREFLTNQQIRGLFDSVAARYPDLQTFLPDLQAGLYHFHRYFPEREIPHIVTFVSEFGHGCLTYGNILGIGLDLYLGKDYPYYASIGFPNFMIQRLEPDQISVNAMNVLATDLLAPNEGRNLLEHMIYQGRALYFMEKMLPHKPEHDLIGYTPEQLAWCKASELAIWSYFIENELLYKQNMQDYLKYISESPTTQGMPPESPGKIAVWAGWQIVRTYMERNPRMSLEDLMAMTDASEVLKSSNYKPKK